MHLIANFFVGILIGSTWPGSCHNIGPTRGWVGTVGLLGFVKTIFWCMLVSNLALDQRFCNGAQGRVLHWHPEKVQARKALSASHPELLVRFAKDSLYNWPKAVSVCPSVRLSTFPLVHSSIRPLVRLSACPLVRSSARLHTIRIRLLSNYTLRNRRCRNQKWRRISITWTSRRAKKRW